MITFEYKDVPKHARGLTMIASRMIKINVFIAASLPLYGSNYFEMPKRTFELLFFPTIRHLLEGLKLERLNAIPDFHIMDFSEMAPGTPSFMPPYRKQFFQINYIESSLQPEVKLNTAGSVGIHQTVYFVSPEHIYSWKWAKDVRGYVIYFDRSFFRFFQD